MARTSGQLRRWASLSALASAALTASAGSGEATIIYHPTHGFTAPGSLPLPGGNGITLNKTHTRSSSEQSIGLGHVRGAFGRRSASTRVSARGVAFKAAGSLVAVTDKGQTFNKVGTRVANNPLMGRRGYRYKYDVGTAWFPYPEGRSVGRPLAGSYFSGWVQNTLGRTYGTLYSGQKYTFIRFSAYHLSTANFPNYNDKYALFRFDVGGQADYGWLELSVGGGQYPFVNVLGYAYQTNGEPIKAGDAPEPQHLPAALGALALGAIGLKEWRKKRNAVG